MCRILAWLGGEKFGGRSQDTAVFRLLSLWKENLLGKMSKKQIGGCLCLNEPLLYAIIAPPISSLIRWIH